MKEQMRTLGHAIGERGFNGGLAAFYPPLVASLVLGPAAWLLFPVTFALVPRIGRAAERVRRAVRLAAGTSWSRSKARNATLGTMLLFALPALVAAVVAPGAAVGALALCYAAGTCVLTPTFARRAYVGAEQARLRKSAAAVQAVSRTTAPAVKPAGLGGGEREVSGRRVAPTVPAKVEMKGRPGFDGMSGPRG